MEKTYTTSSLRWGEGSFKTTLSHRLFSFSPSTKYFGLITILRQVSRLTTICKYVCWATRTTQTLLMSHLVDKLTHRLSSISAGSRDMDINKDKTKSIHVVNQPPLRPSTQVKRQRTPTNMNVHFVVGAARRVETYISTWSPVTTNMRLQSRSSSLKTLLVTVFGTPEAKRVIDINCFSDHRPRTRRITCSSVFDTHTPKSNNNNIDHDYVNSIYIISWSSSS